MIRTLVAIVGLLLLAGAAQAQSTCGGAGLPACTSSNSAGWTPGVVTDPSTPVVTGYEILVCASAPCTASTAGVVTKDVGLPTGACGALPAPCVGLGTLGLGGDGTKHLAVRAYEAQGSRSPVSATLSFLYSTPPVQPAGLTVSAPQAGATDVRYTVTWTALTGLTYRWSAGFNDGTGAQAGSAAAPPVTVTLPYHTSGQAAGGFVCVRAVKNGIEGPQACAPLAVPAAPAPTTPVAPFNLRVQ